MPIQVLSKELQKKAEEELNENPDRTQEDLKHLREWIACQPHLQARTESQWLLGFLRGCKFSLQKTKRKIDLFYAMKTALPEFYANRDPLRPEIQEILKLGLFLPLPKTCGPAGPRVTMIRVSPIDPSKHPFITIVKTCVMIMDILVKEDGHFIVGGQECFLDMKGTNLHHLVQITPVVARKFMCLQYTYPIRPKSIKFINAPMIFESVFNLMRSLTPESLRSRITLHNGNDLEAVQKTIPIEILPEEYGGNGGTINEISDYWKTKVESYRDWFLEDDKYGTVEGKRTRKLDIIQDNFGVEGSFRKINID